MDDRNVPICDTGEDAIGKHHIFDEALIYDAPAGEAAALSVVGTDAYEGRTVSCQNIHTTLFYFCQAIYFCLCSILMLTGDIKLLATS